MPAVEPFPNQLTFRGFVIWPGSTLVDFTRWNATDFDQSVPGQAGQSLNQHVDDPALSFDPTTLRQLDTLGDIVCQTRYWKTNGFVLVRGRARIRGMILTDDLIVNLGGEASDEEVRRMNEALSSPLCTRPIGMAYPQVLLDRIVNAPPRPFIQRDGTINAVDASGRAIATVWFEHYEASIQQRFERIVEIRRTIPPSRVPREGFIYSNYLLGKDPLDNSDPQDPVIRFQVWQTCPDGCWRINHVGVPTAGELSAAAELYNSLQNGRFRQRIQDQRAIRPARKFSIERIVFLRCMDNFFQSQNEDPFIAQFGIPLCGGRSERQCIDAIEDRCRQGASAEERLSNCPFTSGPYQNYIVHLVTPTGPGFRYDVVPQSPLPLGFATPIEVERWMNIAIDQRTFQDQLVECRRQALDAERSQFNIRSNQADQEIDPADLPPEDPRGGQTGQTPGGFGNPFLGGDRNPRQGEFPETTRGPPVVREPDGNGNGGIFGGLDFLSPATLAGAGVGFFVGFAFT